MMTSRTPDKKLAAVCGLFCAACTFYIGSTDDRARLETIAKRFNLTAEQMECHGCRSENQGIYCKTRCNFKKCAAAKGIDFCGECWEFPCTELKTFQAQMPHRIELWESHKRIKEAGWEQWYKEMYEHFSCPECQTVNSTYDIACRKCGNTPSCKYVELHRDEIKKNFGRLGI
jgi:hypothetical protein